MDNFMWSILKSEYIKQNKQVLTLKQKKKVLTVKYKLFFARVYMNACKVFTRTWFKVVKFVSLTQERNYTFYKFIYLWG